MKPNGSVWRHCRARLDLSAKEAAKRLFISSHYLHNIEAEHPRATPSMRLVYRAADLYGVTFEELVKEGAGEEKAPAQPDAGERRPSPRARRRKRDREDPGRADLAEAS